MKIIIPIRCFSCNKPIAQLWEQYEEAVKKGADRKDVLDKLKVERYCCRAMLLGHVDLVEQSAKFKKF